jgi:hypothetical protein
MEVTRVSRSSSVEAVRMYTRMCLPRRFGVHLIATWNYEGQVHDWSRPADLNDHPSHLLL